MDKFDAEYERAVGVEGASAALEALALFATALPKMVIAPNGSLLPATIQNAEVFLVKADDDDGGGAALLHSSTSLEYAVVARWDASIASIALYFAVSVAVDTIAGNVVAAGLVRVIPGPVKGLGRMVFKSGLGYNFDFSRCKDLARLTVQVADLPTAAKVVEALTKSDMLTVMRTKNRFDRSYDTFAIGGYRDYQMICLLSVGGVYWQVEVQVNLDAMVAIKHSSHGPFEQARAIEAFSAANTEYTGKPADRIWEKVESGKGCLACSSTPSYLRLSVPRVDCSVLAPPCSPKIQFINAQPLKPKINS